MSNLLIELHKAGVSPWLDNLKREMFADGSLAKLIAEGGVRGQTSNPSIFQNSISKSSIYDEEILRLAKLGMEAEPIVWELMSEDVRSACDVFKNLFDTSGGADGFVSLELNPTLAADTEASLHQARELIAKVDRPNLMIKVPATKEGIPVVEALTAEGISVNVTLLFSVERYAEVIEAWMRGLEKRAEQGLSLKGINSVASFFISRVDTECDKRLDKAYAADHSLIEKYGDLRGKMAVANACLAYELFLNKTRSERWQKLAALGASVQRPLWASTSTKNPAYKDTLYVDELIGPDCVNTMPDNTVAAFADHGTVKVTLTPEAIAEAHELLDKFAQSGQNLSDVTDNVLMADGVKKFAAAYEQLLEAVAAKRLALLA
ncbi:MAG: transaldolase [Candidatus Bruticola sp.]